MEEGSGEDEEERVHINRAQRVSEAKATTQIRQTLHTHTDSYVSESRKRIPQVSILMNHRHRLYFSKG